MFNKNLLTVRNVLIIGAIAVMWQLILSRVHAYMNQDSAATADA